MDKSIANMNMSEDDDNDTGVFSNNPPLATTENPQYEHSLPHVDAHESMSVSAHHEKTLPEDMNEVGSANMGMDNSTDRAAADSGATISSMNTVEENEHLLSVAEAHTTEVFCAENPKENASLNTDTTNIEYADISLTYDPWNELITKTSDLEKRVSNEKLRHLKQIEDLKAKTTCELTTMDERIKFIEDKWKSNDVLTKVTKQQELLEQIANDNRDRWNSKQLDNESENVAKAMQQVIELLNEFQHEKQHQTNSWLNLMKEIQMAKEGEIREAENRGRLKMEMKDIKEVLKQCEENENKIGAMIDGCVVEMEKLRTEVETLTRLKSATARENTKLLVRIELMQEKLKKTDELKTVLEERLRKVRDLVLSLETFDGRNYDEYRQKISTWLNEDIRMQVKNEQIEAAFNQNNSKPRLKTLIWTQNAIDALPSDCQHKEKFNVIGNGLSHQAGDIKRDVLKGNSHWFTEKIQWVRTMVLDIPRNCIHKDDFQHMAEVLRKAIEGDYSGIKTEMEFTQKQQDGCCLQ